jgi:hypothetical protein
VMCRAPLCDQEEGARFSVNFLSRHMNKKGPSDGFRRARSHVRSVG